MGPSQQALLNVTAKLKNSFLMENEEAPSHIRKHLKKQVFSHLLIGRVKDTNMMFSFILKIGLIDGDQPSNLAV